MSAEEEHRRILEAALKRPKKISFEEFIAAMPEVGGDEIFARGKAKERKKNGSD